MGIERRGRTPLGGDRSVAHLFDEGGTEVEDWDSAVTAEIEEFDGQTSLGRTYIDLRPPDAEMYVPAAPEPDSPHDPENSDAIKALSWDLYFQVDGVFGLVQTKDQLLRSLGWSNLPLAEQRNRVGNLLGLPSWVPAPDGLKKEVYAWLEANRQE